MTKERGAGDIRDKVRGCLLGVAVGDALGAPFEHVRPGETNQAMERTGGRITGFHRCLDLAPGMWTDDTGMTLASCRAFLEAERTGLNLETCFRRAFEGWCGSDESKRAGRTVRRAASSGEADPGS
jgi:ADP-ribosylglycohydrolase